MGKELVEAWNRIKTAPNFMGGTPEYRANTKSEIPYMQDCALVESALQRLNKYEEILSKGRLTYWNYKNTTLDLDSCKPYLRLGQLEDIYEESK